MSGYAIWDIRIFQRKLRDNGYVLDRIKGSHYIYKNCDGRIIPVNKKLNQMVARRLIREYQLK